MINSIRFNEYFCLHLSKDNMLRLSKMHHSVWKKHTAVFHFTNLETEVELQSHSLMMVSVVLDHRDHHH